jgi:hypothetical protein
LVALLAPLGTAVGMGAGTASAHANVTGKGTFNCTKETGTITFKPPLKAKAATVTTTVVTTTSGCKGGTPAVTSFKGNEVMTKANSSCGSFAASSSFSIKLTYTNGAATSTLSGTAKPTIGTPLSFTITGKTTGSYASAKTTAKAILKQTAANLATDCSATGPGIAVLNITGGNVTGA